MMSAAKLRFACHQECLNELLGHLSTDAPPGLSAQAMGVGAAGQDLSKTDATARTWAD